jgi:hypothetical protein
VKCVTVSVRRLWPQAQERALKKVSDSLQRRVEVVSVGTKHLDEMSSFHDYQLAKQERQKEHRANVLARVSGHAWASAGKMTRSQAWPCGRLESRNVQMHGYLEHSRRIHGANFRYM